MKFRSLMIVALVQAISLVLPQQATSGVRRVPAPEVGLSATVLEIEGVKHGPISNSTQSYQFGNLISNAQAQTLSINGENVSGQRLIRARERIFPLRPTAQVDSRFSRWVASPFDVAEIDSNFCPSSPTFTPVLLRTNVNQKGAGQIISRIGKIAMLDSVSNSLSSDISALSEHRPWRRESCDVDLDQWKKKFTSPAAQAYLTAFHEGTSRASFKFPIGQPSVFTDPRQLVLDFSALLIEDLNSQGSRVQSALQKLDSGASPSEKLIEIRRSQKDLFSDWLSLECRELLYVASILPSHIQIFKDEVSLQQLRLLSEIWKNFSERFFSPLTAMEAKVRGGNDHNAARLAEMVRQYEQNSVPPGPDRFDAFSIREYVLLPGRFEDSKLAKQVQMALLNGRMRLGPDRTDFDPREWQMIVNVHSERIVAEFYRMALPQLLETGATSQASLQRLRKTIVENVELARLLGRPGKYPWVNPRFERMDIEEGMTGRTETYAPARRWYDQETALSTLGLTVGNGTPLNVWKDSFFYRFVTDIDAIMWGLYNKVVQNLLDAIDVEATRAQVRQSYSSLISLRETVWRAQDNQTELLLGAEPIWVEECTPSFLSGALKAGDKALRVKPAYRHAIAIALPATHVLNKILIPSSEVTVVVQKSTVVEGGDVVMSGQLNAVQAEGSQPILLFDLSSEPEDDSRLAQIGFFSGAPRGFEVLVVPKSQSELLKAKNFVDALRQQ